ncbi:MAG: hypothetical protein Q8P15_01830 [Nanoarchaeota archaeon]|nr:hypothetical protein [Nanoarchaeota archaeon]
MKKKLIALIGTSLFPLGWILGNHPTLNDEVRIFRTENGVRIIRTYEEGKQDKIYVQSPDDSTKFIVPEKYFEQKNIGEKDRDVEYTKIKRLVKW